MKSGETQQIDGLLGQIRRLGVKEVSLGGPHCQSLFEFGSKFIFFRGKECINFLK